MCHVTLYASRNWWKTLWIDSFIAFINDALLLKRVKCNYSGLIFNTFSFCAGKFLSIMCACTLREKHPYSEFFWSVFSRIRTEYGEIRSIQSKCGKIRTRKYSVSEHFSYSEHFPCFMKVSHVDIWTAKFTILSFGPFYSL